MHASDPTQTFLVEAAELLDRIEEIVLGAEQTPLDAEAVNRLFRAFHTIKGSGAMFGFEAVAEFTHSVESALDRVRAGSVPLSRRLLELILAARDHIKSLLDPAANSADHGAASAQIVAAIRDVMEASDTVPFAAPAASPRGGDAPALWRVRFRPSRQIARSGLDPLTLVAELRGLGACTVTALLDAVPPVESLHGEECHVGWEIVFSTPVTRNAIQDVFIFVEGESEVVIEPATAPRSDLVAAVVSSAPAAGASRAAAGKHSPVGVRKVHSAESTVRVPSARLDRLVNLVGEFVMNQSRLAQVSARLDDPDLAPPVEAIERLVAELRDTVLGIRMMPIGSTFNRFKRLVHDLSQELGKEIDLVAEGAETELDKTVLDQLGDPLVHLIRNCIDHAIGTPEERLRLGKSRRGTIRLTATHAGSHVVIAIKDDGRGLDRDAIRAKAIERNLITADANPTEKELFNLIFLPGFSTAKQVTNVSGRGVGMDVVKKQIDALRGSIHLASQAGVGTTISLTLPLTLAIIDGLLVELGGDQFILPMSAVAENVELHRAERFRQNGRNVVAVRGELIPYLRLRELFRLPGDGPVIEKIVIAHHEDQRVGLVVDRVLGSHQTVIQPLGRFHRNVEVCSGSTIMGDGRVALILDLPGLIRFAKSSTSLPGCHAA